MHILVELCIYNLFPIPGFDRLLSASWRCPSKAINGILIPDLVCASLVSILDSTVLYKGNRSRSKFPLIHTASSLASEKYIGNSEPIKRLRISVNLRSIDIRRGTRRSNMWTWLLCNFFSLDKRLRQIIVGDEGGEGFFTYHQSCIGKIFTFMYTDEYSTFVKLKSRCGKFQYFFYKSLGGGGWPLFSWLYTLQLIDIVYIRDYIE